MNTSREALEAALARTPDDLALHMAYADCLLEDGDPRGEYIRLCLAAEESSETKKERKLRREEALAFLQKHEAHWLGDLKEFLLSPDESRRKIGSRPRVLLEWKRGWILGVTCYNLNDDLIAALHKHPLMPFLESLAVDANSYRRRSEPTRENWAEDDRAMHREPYWFLREWPTSPMKRLLIQDTDFHDLGVTILLQSLCFPRLQSLSLSNCNITDEGAAMLAQHPHTPELESLRLEQNLISPLGIELLAEVGVRVSELQRFGRLEDM